MINENEIDKIIYDEDGNIIDIIEPDADDEIPEHNDDYYATVGAESINTESSTTEMLIKAKDEFDTAKEDLLSLFKKVLENGEITADDRYSIRELSEKTITSYSAFKDMSTSEKEKTIEEQLEEIKADMVQATPDDILDILTEGGTKCWLYKDDDNNVLIDGTSIPELTMLVNKLNLIATGDGEDSMIQLTPEFINMVVEESGNGDSVKSIVTKYYLSTSREELIGGSWLDTLPTAIEQEGKFLWYKIVTTYVSETKEPSETDPVCISAKDGDKGDKGDTGNGVEEIIMQYAINQSTTTAPDSGWDISMPSYQEGYYLWIRTRIKYTDSVEYVYSIPVCDQSWKSNQEVYTQYKQLSDKFTWIVKSGTSESNMQLTDALIQLISNTITLTAEHINLNGYVSNDNANWSIDNEGNMHVENLKVDGDISGDTLTINYIDNPCYPATLAGSVELLVNANTGNDDYTIDDILQSYDEAEEKNNDSLKKKFKTIQGAIDAIPKFLNNKTVYITMETNSTEDVYIRGAVGGAIRIYMNGKTLFGTLKTYACSATITTYGGTKSNTEGATGVIHPNVGLSFGTRAVSVGFEASQYAALYKIKVYAPDNIPSDITNTDKVCVASQAGTGSVYCKNVEIVNATVGFRSNNHGSMHINTSSGVASKYGFQSVTGGIISLANNNQCGGKTGNTNKNSGGQIWYEDGKPTFATGNQTTDGGSAPVAPTTKTMTIKSTYGDTYRSSVYNSWKKDGSARQGDYGYGDCIGCWFFGTAFSELKGKTITKVQITITRNSGGSSSAVGLAVKTHNYSARPSGAPTLGTSCGTLSLATGSTGTLTITNSTVLNGISNGTVKGFAIRSTYDSAHYAVCSGNATVKITYTE